MIRTLRKYTKVILIIVILFFVASCFAGYGLYVRGGARQGEGMRDYPVAEIDGRKVMRSALEQGAARLSERYGSNITSSDVPMIRKAVIDNMAVDAELEKEIKMRKIEAPESEIDEAYKRMMDSYPTREEFFAYMQRSGITEKQMKDDIARQLRMQKLMESLGEKVTVEDKEVKAFYDATKDFLYKQPAGIKANVATFRKRESAEAAQKAIAAGGKWDEEIEKHRPDVEMATPYEHPVILTDQMLQSELAVVKDLPLNEISPVEKANDPFVFIAINRGHEAERVLPFDEVSGDVRATVRSQKMQAEQGKFFDELRARADVKILDAEIFPSEKAAEPASADVTAPAAETKKPEDKKEAASGNASTTDAETKSKDKAEPASADAK